MPGRPYLGIELPNDEPLVVTVREMMESEAWVASRANLKLALGKDVVGTVRVVDLTAMPHLLIAGGDRRRKVGVPHVADHRPS